MNRRRFCVGLALTSLGWSSHALTSQPYMVTDMAGRTLQLVDAPRRIVLLEARDIITMAMLHPDPTSLVVGWAAVDRIDSDSLKEYFECNGSISVVGKQAPITISIEAIVSLAPDLVVTSSLMMPQDGTSDLFQRLKTLGIPVAFSDVASNSKASHAAGPIETLHRNLYMWGNILDAGSSAAAYSSFANEHLANVARRLVGAKPVTTYLEVQSTTDDCCWVAGSHIWGELLALAGGQSLPGVTEAWYQKLQLEYLLATPHDVYIASGGGWVSGGRPAIGPGINASQGRAGLKRIISRTGFSSLPSVRQGRVHGIWTGLITVALLNPLFVEVAAKWLHPDRFSDFNPANTLETINRRFLKKPIDGPLWVSLQE